MIHLTFAGFRTSHLVALFDPFAAARATDFFRAHPPGNGMWLIASPMDQPELPVERRRSMIVWKPASGGYALCAAAVATLYRDGAMLGDVQLIGRDAAGQAVVTRTLKDGGLWQQRG